MRRREFVAGLGGAAVAWPLAGHAQPAPGRPLVGFLTPAPAIAVARNIEVLRAALRELGYVEGHNIWLEFRHADGELARLPTLAAELVARKPDVIIAAASQGVLAAHGATRTIPIVMNSLVDPDVIVGRASFRDPEAGQKEPAGGLDPPAGFFARGGP